MFLHSLKRLSSKSAAASKMPSLTSTFLMQQRMAQMSIYRNNALNKPAGASASYHD